jgi:ubiquinone/menaquinone biosynthesis C-methylase UbiE
MRFLNVYEDSRRAAAYAALEFPNTYYLAFRDLPGILAAHAPGRRAIDFGCGAGRSTRFLRRLGFEAAGIDIADDMLRKAREIDPGGDYRRTESGRLTGFADATCDLVLSAFTFDNIPTRAQKLAALRELERILTRVGRIVNLVSAPEIYTHEWASFTTRDFPENRRARSGDRVRIVMTDVPDRRPVEDVLWADDAYREIYAAAGLTVIEMHKPLARESEPYPWVNETRIAPWVIYVLGKAGCGECALP